MADTLKIVITTKGTKHTTEIPVGEKFSVELDYSGIGAEPPPPVAVPVANIGAPPPDPKDI